MVSIVLVSACEPSVDDQKTDLKKYFKDNQIGMSADYAVIKNSLPADKDFIISVHGFIDDKTMCEKISAMLNFDEPNAFSCKPLN